MSDDKPTNLNVQRAEKAGDCRLMTVKDCLEDTLARCEDMGWTKCVISLYRPVGEGQFYVDRQIAGCSTLEACGLMFGSLKEEFHG